jgi:hypothetical protein
MTSKQLDTVIKDAWLEPIKKAMMEPSPIMEWFDEIRDRQMDWGFDAINARAVDQPWFKQWERRVRSESDAW